MLWRGTSTNQFKIEGAHQNVIPDIVCFVNGLPLAVIECKSPYVADAISEGINQLRRYANLELSAANHSNVVRRFCLYGYFAGNMLRYWLVERTGSQKV